MLIITFLWKAFEAWHKYNKKDTMMLTEVKHPIIRTFPSVTLCKGIMQQLFHGNVSQEVEFNTKLDNWLRSKFDDEAEI